MLSCTDFLMACGIASLFAMTIHLFYFPTVTTSYWLLNMGARGRNLKRLNGDPLRSGDLYARWRGH